MYVYELPPLRCLYWTISTTFSHISEADARSVADIATSSSISRHNQDTNIVRLEFGEGASGATEANGNAATLVPLEDLERRISSLSGGDAASHRPERRSFVEKNVEAVRIFEIVEGTDGDGSLENLRRSGSSAVSLAIEIHYNAVCVTGRVDDIVGETKL